MKYALVTGASSGIGWHISRELATRSYSIVAVSNQGEQLENLKKNLEQEFSVEIITLTIDLALPDAAREVFKFCESSELEIEVLVNNAGILIMGEAVDAKPEKAATILQLHVVTPALLCQLFGKKMVARKSGFILNVSSISAVMPYPIISFYGPTKTFLRFFSRALRTEMKPAGVKITCLMPGATDTPLYENPPADIPFARKLGVMQNPDSVARSGVNALFKGKAECIPGIINKLVIWFFPFIPQFLITWLYGFRIRKKSKD